MLPRPATARPPPTCSRSSTTSCGSSPPRGWPPRSPGHTLDATALVHEAYLRLVGDSAVRRPRPLLRRRRRGHAPHPGQPCPRRKRLKRGGGRVRLELLDQAGRWPKIADLRPVAGRAARPGSPARTPPRPRSPNCTCSAGCRSRRRAEALGVSAAGRLPELEVRPRPGSATALGKIIRNRARHFSPRTGH